MSLEAEFWIVVGCAFVAWTCVGVMFWVTLTQRRTIARLFDLVEFWKARAEGRGYALAAESDPTGGIARAELRKRGL